MYNIIIYTHTPQMYFFQAKTGSSCLYCFCDFFPAPYLTFYEAIDIFLNIILMPAYIPTT